MKHNEEKVYQLMAQYNLTMESMRALRATITSIVADDGPGMFDIKYEAAIQISLAMDNLMELQKLFTSLNVK